MGRASRGQSCGGENVGRPRSVIANERQVIERERRPSTVDSVDKLQAPLDATSAMDSATTLTLREESPPEMRSFGRSASGEVCVLWDARTGGPSRTAWPLEPPIPELDIAIRGRRSE